MSKILVFREVDGDDYALAIEDHANPLDLDCPFVPLGAAVQLRTLGFDDQDFINAIDRLIWSVCHAAKAGDRGVFAANVFELMQLVRLICTS